MKSSGTDALPLDSLTALTPLDGRYRSRVASLAQYVSEYALIKARFRIEAQYLIALSAIGIVRKLTAKEKKILETFGEDITLSDAKAVKKIESTIRHDVKAMEQVFRTKLNGTSLENIIEQIHFGLTSEDVNNVAYRLLLRDGTMQVSIPTIKNIIMQLANLADTYKSLPMLARTHGQPAVPTTVGKELIVFAYRLLNEVKKLETYQLSGKMSGAVGNFNALVLSYPDIDWISFAKTFLSSLGFTPNLVTTQINPYEDVIEMLQIYQRINGILLDLDQDMWRYISDGWFVQIVKKDEVGSSTMPQKVNPEDFEKSEGNLQLANSLIEGMVRKLAVSRLQRDLSDSTTVRNVGTVLGYCYFAYESTLAGLQRVKPNREKITEDLLSDWSILSEGVQTILRQEQVKDAYMLVKSLTRGKHLQQIEWQQWVGKLPISDTGKKKLASLTPQTYIGLAEKITEKAIKEIRKIL